MDNIKVMIVDDDNLAVEDLKSLISWEQYGFEVVATASDGKEALESYCQYHPQIVLIDIKMPVMDGLEFCRRVFIMGRPIKILLLTAYKDFDYARQALELGASNYLLKHEINENSLLREIKKVRDELLKEEINHNIVRRQFVREVLFGKNIESFEAENAYLSPFISAKGFVLLLLKADTPYPVIQIDMENGAFPAMEVMEKECMKLTDNLEHLGNIDMDGGKLAVLLSSGNLNSFREIRERAYKTSINLLKTLKEKTGKTHSSIVAFTEKGYNDIPAIYQKIQNTFKFYPFYGREKVIFTDDIMETVVPDSSEVDRDIKELLNAFIEKNDKKLADLLENLFNRTIHPVIRPDAFRTLCSKLVHILDDYRIHNGLDVMEKVYRQGGIDTNLWYNFRDIVKWFLSEFEKNMKYNAGIDFGRCSKKVRQAVQYISAHCADDLSVDEVARELGISKVYLFQLFHNETGHTILDYITKFRIEKAKLLLKNSNYKIYEIAEKTGYQSSQYFSKIFFKYIGMTPLEYREGD